jgi:Rrf2 family protein
MMSISTRGRYAARIMVLLASRPDRPSLTKREIAEAEGITPAYVQQLMLALRMAGLVASHRGREGGFSLSRPAETITLADVLCAVEGEIMPAPCRSAGHCERAAWCPTRPLWQKAADLLDGLFSGTTVADLAAKQAEGDMAGWL